MQSRNPSENKKNQAVSSCPAFAGSRRAISAWRLLPCLALLGGLSVPIQAHADTDLLMASLLGTQAAQGSQDTQDAAADANAGPVRLARFSTLTGDVTWRDSTDGSWSPASQNMPLRQGAQIWVSEGGRAEIQFDDGSRIRLDSNTLITLQTLYSDTEGEFTEITLNDGHVYLRLNNKYSLYQVNTPQASLKAAGPAQIRIGGGKGAEFGVRSGAANVEGAGGKAELNAGDYLDLADANAPYRVEELPRADNWDTWNLSRDEAIDNAGRTVSPHLPSNIALVADDLEEDGAWHNDGQYGWVWAPRNVNADWRPYRAGRWTWVEPFGWTWVSTERWGWAPYHYGTWVHQSYGWAWCPGPATQYWSPGVVSFTESAGVMAWCPLAPHEVRYPSRLALGFRNGNWSTFFSIGGAAVYYPSNDRYCDPRPFRNVYVNRVTYINHVTNVTNVYNVNNITVNRNTYLTNARFVPGNARWQGGTQVAVGAFGGHGVYQPAVGGAQSIFARGRVIGGPVSGHPVAGPQSVHVTAQSLTPSRVYQSPKQLPQQFVNRTVYRAPLPSNVPVVQAKPQRGQQFTNHPVGTNPTVIRRNGTEETRPVLPGRPNDGKPTFNPNPNGPGRVTNGTGNAGTRPVLPGRPAEGNGSRPTTSTGNTGNTGRSGLDAYLQDRKTRNGGATGQTGGNTGKPVIPGGKTDTTTRHYGDNPNGTKTDTTHRFGDNPNGTRTDTTHRNGETPTTPKTDTTRRYGDNPTTRRNGDNPTSKPDTTPTRRFGDNPNTPKTDTTHRTGDNPATGNGSRTSRSNGDTSRTTHPGGTGNAGGTRTPPAGKGDSGKSGRTTNDTKSTDQKKDSSKADYPSH